MLWSRWFSLKQGSYATTDLDANASVWDIVTGLENTPNIGTVSVIANGNNLSAWEIAFTSEVGAFPSLEV